MLKPYYLHRPYQAPISLLPLFHSWKIIVDLWRSQPWGNWWCTRNSWPNSLILPIEMTALLPVPLTTHLCLPCDLCKMRRALKVWSFFPPQMTPTIYSLSPGTGNRALNNDHTAVTHTPTKRYLRCTKNISILVEHLNYPFMAIPCLHQGCISWQVRWLMIQQIVKSFFCKN